MIIPIKYLKGLSWVLAMSGPILLCPEAQALLDFGPCQFVLHKDSIEIKLEERSGSQVGIDEEQLVIVSKKCTMLYDRSNPLTLQMNIEIETISSFKEILDLASESAIDFKIPPSPKLLAASERFGQKVPPEIWAQTPPALKFMLSQVNQIDFQSFTSRDDYTIYLYLPRLSGEAHPIALRLAPRILDCTTDEIMHDGFILDLDKQSPSYKTFWSGHNNIRYEHYYLDGSDSTFRIVQEENPGATRYAQTTGGALVQFYFESGIEIMPSYAKRHQNEILQTIFAKW